MTENESEKKKEIAEKYKLTEYDANYMVAYKFHK